MERKSAKEKQKPIGGTKTRLTKQGEEQQS